MTGPHTDEATYWRRRYDAMLDERLAKIEEGQARIELELGGLKRQFYVLMGVLSAAVFAANIIGPYLANLATR